MNIDDDDFSFNEYDDFFNQFGENGMDPEKYKNYFKKIYRELTGQEIDEDNEFLSGTGNYMQDLSSAEEMEIFNSFVEDRNMELDINFIDEFGTLLIEERWHSEEYGINLKRTYHYDHTVISKLNDKIKREIYEKMLPQVVEKEDFEEAVIIRDILSSLEK